MVSVADSVQLLVMLFVNATATALMTRFFRVRLTTRWGPVVFALALIPPVLVILTQVMSAAGFGFDLGDPVTVVVLLILVPFALGMTFDYFWMPDPEEVTLPDKYQ
ncbi:hypothetical protein [Halocatena pleomorpha]|uniref:DUF7991 domain-containing protein n=1 Tax=Halocatena pleomorpha TaxID=1785090 RepID=A0A3P3R2M5_9EURY|nr:hypothetical protein [Halocatena pleomorpha]RRJ27625.1 hypothetical protein EIK79_17485 [Halocatena pleomorpha]